eukprot:1144437-Pelagomonas_calceolata.AAC.4
MHAFDCFNPASNKGTPCPGCLPHILQPAHLVVTRLLLRPPFCANDQQRLSCAPFFHTAPHARWPGAAGGLAGTKSTFAKAAAAKTVAAGAGHNSMGVTLRRG